MEIKKSLKAVADAVKGKFEKENIKDRISEKMPFDPTDIRELPDLKEVQEIDLIGILRDREIIIEVEPAREIRIHAAGGELRAELWEMIQNGADDYTWDIREEYKVRID